MPDLDLTPAAWLAFLNRKLDVQAKAVQRPVDYFNGNHQLAHATAKFREAFSRYFPPMSNNWMKLVVQAPLARIKVQGFRFDPDPTKPSWDQQADQEAWGVWQANNMDVQSDMAHCEAIKAGVVNLLVGPASEPGGEPIITVELAATTYVYVSPENRRRRVAAIKRWKGDDGYVYATVYLPTVLHKFRSQEKLRDGRPLSTVQWVRRQDDPVDNNPMGVVPMIPMENDPDLLYGGRSDLEPAMPIQDAVNKFCLDMQVSSEFHAYPQRFATGWERAQDVSGNELTDRQVELYASMSRLWRAESSETKFGQLSPGDVANYIQPIEMYVDHLAAVTQTPAYYLKGKMANLSAEALQAADAGLDDRAERKLLPFGEAYEEMMRVAFLAKGDQRRGRAVQAETLWAPVRRLSLGQVVDAAVKMRESLTVPLEMCWEMLGWSPQKIAQAKSMMNLPDSPPARPNPGPTPSAGTRAVVLPPGVNLPTTRPSNGQVG